MKVKPVFQKLIHRLEILIYKKRKSLYFILRKILRVIYLKKKKIPNEEKMKKIAENSQRRDFLIRVAQIKRKEIEEQKFIFSHLIS